jgi:phosphatidate cytidylyltransferase
VECDVATAIPAGVTVHGLGGRGMVKRLASAIVLLPVFLLILIKAPAYLFNALVVIASAAALWELTRLLETGGRPVYRVLAVVAGTAVTAAFGASRLLDPFALPAFVLALAVLAILAAPMWRGVTPATEPAANTLLAVMYVGWLLGYGILLHRTSSRGDEVVLFVVGVTWVGETMAYVVGSTLGRHKLAPVISPRKTVEGAVAQVLASVLTGLALGAWLLPGCGISVSMAGGALLGVVGQVGDLTESVIKRSVGTKDTGGIIPGHGGVLDRIDSLLFNLPAFYYYALMAACS